MSVICTLAPEDSATIRSVVGELAKVVQRLLDSHGLEDAEAASRYLRGELNAETIRNLQRGRYKSPQRRTIQVLVERLGADETEIRAAINRDKAQAAIQAAGDPLAGLDTSGMSPAQLREMAKVLERMAREREQD